MPKPGDDIKTTALFLALGALGTKHRSMKLGVLEKYATILEAPEVKRRARRQTRLPQLAAAAHVAITAAIAEFHDELNDVAQAVMCASDYDGQLVKQRIAALRQKYSEYDHEDYKYQRLVVLDRIYRYLTREPSPDNDWVTSTWSTIHPAGWEVAPELLPTLGRLRYRIAQFRYGALGLSFVGRMTDRLAAESIYSLRRLTTKYETFPVPWDVLFGPCAHYALARDEFEDRFGSWRDTYITLWQQTKLSTQLDALEIFQPPIRNAAIVWASGDIDGDALGQLDGFYPKTWLPWVKQNMPRYARSMSNSLEIKAFQSWELLQTLSGLFGDDPSPDMSARTEMEETLLTFFRRLSRAIAVNEQPLRRVVNDYLSKRGKVMFDEPLHWDHVRF